MTRGNARQLHMRYEFTNCWNTFANNSVRWKFYASVNEECSSIRETK